MTVIIGALCTDGVVMGCDSSMTLGDDAQTRTIEQPISNKIEIISQPPVITAITGSVGLGQRFREIVGRQKTLEGIKRDVLPLDTARLITSLCVNDFVSTGANQRQIGALMAFHHKGGFQLCEFCQKDFQPEFKDNEHWFEAMGSGKRLVDPFLGLLRRIFWNDSQPSVNDGVFVVLWALKLAIEINPGGINGPPRIAVLADIPNEKYPVARWLKDDELLEHETNISGIEEMLRRYRADFGKAEVEGPPTAPI